MKALDRIAAAFGLLVALVLLASLVASVGETPRRIAACKTEGGTWTHVPTAGEHLPGGLPLYVCKTP